MLKRGWHFICHSFSTMKKYCYFCKGEEINNEANNYTDDNYWCKKCKDINGLWSVVTSYNSPDIIIYAHIYVDLAPDKKYHIRLHIQDDVTTVEHLNNWGQSNVTCHIQIPGIGLTPSNVRQKLPLYLVFS